MATTPVEFRAPTGLTLTLELYAYGSDTIGNTGGDSATEATNRKGLYSANVTEALAGWYTAHVKSGSTVIAVYDVFMVDDTNVHRCTDRPQDQAQETVASVTATVSADVVSISGDSTAADNLEAACDGAGYNLGGGSVVAASVTGAVGSVTGAVGSVTGNVGGIAGTITSLDALNTAIRGADSDTLKTLSDQIDGISSGSSPQLLQNTTIATLATQTSFTLTAGSADDDAYNGAVAIFTDQATATQKAFVAISDYVGSTRTITLAAAPAFTIATGDTIDIVAAASDAPTAAAIRAEIDNNSTQLAAIVADTNELQTDWANGGRLDLLVDAILEDTGTTLPAAIPSASAIATTVLTTQMTESYAAAGAAPTLTQAVCWLYQDVQEAAVSGTTKTVKRLDQTTAAGTVTLDDANTPTSLTRAT